MDGRVMEFRFVDNFYEDGLRFIIIEEKFGKKYIAQPMTMEEWKDSEITKDTGVISRSDAQGLFNRLWEMGFRPKDGTGNSGHVAAIEYHLEDMRRLVFKGPPHETV